MIGKEEIRRVLLERKLYASISDGLEDDTEITFDSLSLIWFLHGLEKEYGIRVSLADDEFVEFTSVNKIYEYLTRKQAETHGKKMERGGE